MTLSDLTLRSKVKINLPLCSAPETTRKHVSYDVNTIFTDIDLLWLLLNLDLCLAMHRIPTGYLSFICKYCRMAWTCCYGLLGLCGKKLNTPIFYIGPDLELKHYLWKLFQIIHKERLFKSFGSPPRPYRCDHWFGSYRLGAFSAPPSKWPVARYPSKCRDNYGRRSLTRHDLRS